MQVGTESTIRLLRAAASAVANRGSADTARAMQSVAEFISGRIAALFRDAGMDRSTACGASGNDSSRSIDTGTIKAAAMAAARIIPDSCRYRSQGWRRRKLKSLARVR